MAIFEPWIEPSSLGIASHSLLDIVRRLSSLPRAAAVTSLCTLISARDLQPEARYLGEGEFIAGPLLKKVNIYRAAGGVPAAVFHFRQLLLMLALTIKHADASDVSERLSKDQCFELGELCLHLSAVRLAEHAEEPFEKWCRSPISSRSSTAMELTASVLFSVPPRNGFLSVFRAYRILFVHLQAACRKYKLPMSALSSEFKSRHGVSPERAWAILALFCQTRYPVGGVGPRQPLIDVSRRESSLALTDSEISGLRGMLAADLDQLSTQLPSDSAANMSAIYRVLTAKPLIALSSTVWWGHGPILAERALRTLYFELRSCAGTRYVGAFDNAFGMSVELYVGELLALASASATLAHKGALTYSKIRESTAPRPDLEIGIGPVRQLLEVKAKYFPPDRLLGSGWSKSFEENLFAKDKGLGQLASYAVERCSGCHSKVPARIQSLLVVLESLPFDIAGIQHEARSLYSEYIDSYLAEATEQDASVMSGPARRQVLCLSIGELEYVLSGVTVGQDLKDIIDRLYNELTDTFMPAWSLPPSTVFGRSDHPDHNWLGAAFDELFKFYDLQLA